MPLRPDRVVCHAGRERGHQRISESVSERSRKQVAGEKWPRGGGKGIQLLGMHGGSQQLKMAHRRLAASCMSLAAWINDYGESKESEEQPP